MKNRSKNSLTALFAVLMMAVTLITFQAPHTNASKDFAIATKNSISGEEGLKTFTSKEGLGFKYSLGWQIVTMAGLDFLDSTEDALESTHGITLDWLRAIYINFDKPHDFGEYESNVDIAVYDLTLSEGENQSLKQLIQNMEKAFEVQGQTEAVTSNSGVEFLAWWGPSPVYENTSLVVYLTQYTDNEGRRHIVKIEHTGDDLNGAVPVMDTLKLNQ